MPNPSWYRKNRADILSVSTSVYINMLSNDALLHLDHEEIAQSAVDYAVILVAEIDQRGIEPVQFIENQVREAQYRAMQQWDESHILYRPMPTQQGT